MLCIVRRLFALTVFGLMLSGCSETAETRHRSSSHSQMLSTLESIRESRPYEQMYYGKKTVESEEQELSLIPNAFSGDRFDRLYRLGQRRLWLGDTEKAIENFQAASELVREHADNDSDSKWEKIVFQLGLAWLRLGENENCVHCNNGESCLFPIQHAGVHQNNVGSQNAVTYFKLLLDRNPKHLPGRWLLNVACMTLGVFPDQVPSEFRIDLELFESETEFPRFHNTASTHGLNVQNSSGGCILGDFDGDGDLDAVVSSSGQNTQFIVAE